MKPVCVFSFLLLLSGLSSCESRRGVFDHFWLVLTWQPTFCQEKRCWTPPEETFTIHGLWPVDARGYTLLDTVQPNANLRWLTDTSSPLVRDLTMYWPSLGQRTNKGFWEHEWDRHGSKQGEVRPQDYFQRAVSLVRTRDIVTALKKKEVIPNNTRGHSSTQFANALVNVIGTDQVMLTCSKIALRELRICVDRLAARFIRCNANEMSSASCARMSQFIFPSISFGRRVSGGGIESLDRSMFKLLCMCIIIVINVVSRQDWLLL